MKKIGMIGVGVATPTFAKMRSGGLLALAAVLCGCQTRPPAALVDVKNLRVSADVSRRYTGDFNYHDNRGHNFGGGNLFTADVGMCVPLDHGITLRYGIRHESLVDKKDAGNDRVYSGLTWEPFR